MNKENFAQRPWLRKFGLQGRCEESYQRMGKVMAVLSDKLCNHPMDTRVNSKNALHEVPWPTEL